MNRGTGGRDERFVREVLARTTGSACGRALDLLPELSTGDLADLDRRLVQGHLEHCQRCRAVAVVLGWLDTELSALAEIDPGPSFTRAVLSRTSGQARAEAERRRLTGAAGLMDRVGRWWEGRIQRPVFAAQVAYAATVVLVLLTAVPGAPLRELPGQAMKLVQAGPTSVPVVDLVLGRATGWVETRAVGAVDAGRSRVVGQWRQVESDLGGRAERTAGDRRLLRSHLQGMITQAGEGRLGQAGYQFLAAGRDISSFWNHWWHVD